MELGSKQDKEQEDISTETTEITLNLDQATICYLSFNQSLENTNKLIEYLNKLRMLPFDQRQNPLTNEQINDEMRLAKFTKEKLTYLIQEAKEAVIYLDGEESEVIKKPKWGK